MTLYDACVAVHVGAAVVGFGPTFAYPVIQLAAERRDRAALPFALGRSTLLIAALVGRRLG